MDNQNITIKLIQFTKAISECMKENLRLQSQLKQAKYKRLNSIFLAQYFRDENKKLQSQLEERDKLINELWDLWESFLKQER